VFKEECTALGGLSGRAAFEALSEIIKMARSAGIDVNKWLRAKSLISVFGATAEAKYTSRSFEDVWNSYECENDQRDAVQDCMIGGTIEVDDIDAIIKEAEVAAENLIKRPEVWRAIVALADSLPAVGKFQGKQAAAIIKSAMKD